MKTMKRLDRSEKKAARRLSGATECPFHPNGTLVVSASGEAVSIGGKSH